MFTKSLINIYPIHDTRSFAPIHTGYDKTQNSALCVQQGTCWSNRLLSDNCLSYRQPAWHITELWLQSSKQAFLVSKDHMSFHLHPLYPQGQVGAWEPWSLPKSLAGMVLMGWLHLVLVWLVVSWKHHHQGMLLVLNQSHGPFAACSIPKYSWSSYWCMQSLSSRGCTWSVDLWTPNQSQWHSAMLSHHGCSWQLHWKGNRCQSELNTISMQSSW